MWQVKKRVKMKLTAKQEKFAQCIADGMLQADAYRECYSTKNMKNETVWQKASRLFHLGKVRARIDELKSKIEKEVVKEFSKSRIDLLNEFEELKHMNLNKDDVREAKACLIEQGKLLGYYTEKRENVNTHFNVLPNIKIDGKDVDFDVGS